MNVGLNSKRNIPLITNSFGTNDTAYLNLDKNNANLIINIPTITKNEGVENKIGDISLLYNYLCRDTTSHFGKGIILSIMKYVEDIEKDDNGKIEKIKILNSDFTKTIFTREESTNIFKNSDTDSFIVYDILDEEVYIDDPYAYIKLYDNTGNYYQFNHDGESSYCNPTLIHKVEFSDDEDIMFNIDLTNSLTITYKNQKVEVNLLSTKIENIKFFVNNIEYSRCEFQYSGDYLTDIYKYIYHIDDNGEVVNGLVEHKNYVLSDPGYIKIKDAITEYFTKYYITDNKVSSFINCIEDNEESGKETLIRYNDSYTNVINYKGQLNNYYLVNGRIEHIQYHNGRISTVKYDGDGRIIERINNLDVSDEGKEKNGNLFTAGSTFEEGSYTVTNLAGDSFVNVTTLYDGTKGLSLYNDSELEEIEIKFIIDDIYVTRGQGVTFIVDMLKLNSSNCEPLEFIVYLYDKNRPHYILAAESLYLKANELNGYYINTSKMHIVNDTFNTAEVVIKVPANYGRSVILNMQLYCDLLGTINEYDSYGCISKLWDRKNVISRSFIKEDKRLLLTGTNTDANASVINYDEHGKAIEIINGDGTRVEKTYDTNGNCISYKVKNKNNNYIETNTTYTSDGLQVASETNNDGATSSYEYDQYNRVLKKATYPNGLVDEITYNNKLFVVKQESIADSNKTIFKDFTYNSNDRLETVKINNNYSYKFEYDAYGNVISTKLVKNTTLTELEKDTYEVNSNIYTGNLQTRRVGNNDSVNNKRKYTYDLEDRLEKVYLTDDNVETLLYEFEYDSLGNLTKIIDHKYNEEINFLYDKYNNMIQEETIKGNLSVKKNYKYDFKGNLLSTNAIINNTNLGHYIFNNGERKFKSPAKLFNYYNNIKNLYNCLLLSKDSSGNVKADLMGSSGIIKHANKAKIPAVIEYGDGIVKSFSLSNSIHKDLTYKHSLNKTIGAGNTFAFWFKTSSYTTNNDKTLFSICDLSDSGGKSIKYDIALSSEGKIKFFNGITTTSNAINLNTWNFIAFKLTQNDSGATLTVMLNGEVSTLTSSNKLTAESQEVCFGDYVQNQESIYGTTGEITCLFMSDTLLDDVTIKEIYKQTKESYIDYVSLDNDRFNKHFVTSKIDNNTSYNIIPLKNSFESLDNTLEYDFENSDLFKKELDNLFKYDDIFKDYVYNLERHKLVYKVPYSGAMHIGVKALIKELTGNQMILEFANQYQGLIGLFIDSNGLLKGYINSIIIDTGVTITPNTINKYFIAYSLDNYNEQTHMYVYKVRIMLNDDILVESFYEMTSELLVEKVVIGASLNKTTYSSFNGSMNMLCINTTTSSLDNALDLDSGDRVIDKANNMGQLFEHQVLKDNQNIIKHNVTYKGSVDTASEKCYNTIIKDEFFTSDLDNSVRKIDYQNDLNTGNVTRRTLCNQTQTLDDVEYVYDKFGQLTEERNYADDLKIVYSYDRIGNLSGKFEYQLSTNTLINRTYFECDTTNPTKLVNFTKNNASKTISYHDNMLGMPKNIVDDEGNVVCSFDWDYRNLSKYTVSQDYYINYTYNLNRLRTSKVIVNNIAGGTIVHNYRYSGNLLIEEVVDDNIKGETYKLNYLYDQFGMLYGFKYNNSLYYYLRDSLGTIIGLVDSSKQLVCEYKYDAYGNHTVLNGNRVEALSKYFVGNINPFRYKGYYFDSETSLYYCETRYYSPEWCRWISPDDVSYLDLENVNGLNLYCYCMNNPIMYVDRSGHFAIISFIISVAVSSAISIVMEVIEDSKDGQYFNDKDGWDYFAAALGGAISGMAGNVATAFLLGGVASMVETAFSGEATSDNMVSTFLTGALGGLIGFGVGEVAKYLASFMEAGVGKIISKISSKKTINSTINKMINKMGATTTKIGMKGIRKITSGLAAAERNYFAVTISSLASGWF